ncbi:hypothetical protein [Rhizobium sp.]|jgi:hypothetical protein|uniref:hypothetical protein n=1 Tax=Rhizobium sp. TaxID=391 RepID=UPI002AA821C2
MPDALGRTTENDFAQSVLHILSTKPGGQATFQQLFRDLPKLIVLTTQDQSPSTRRPGESFWQQRVRNITSHKNNPNNYIARGYLLSINNGLKITPKGRSHIGL